MKAAADSKKKKQDFKRITGKVNRTVNFKK